MSNFEPGDRIMAVRNYDEKQKVLYIFGAGTYQGRELPTDDVPGGRDLRMREIENPKLVMDDGTVVWGMESWWGPEENIKAMFEPEEVEYKTVKPQRLQPREDKAIDIWK